MDMTQDTAQAPLSDSEIVAETFQAIRVRELKTVDEVKAVMLERFPDIDDERRQACLVKLATILCRANEDLFNPEKQRALRGGKMGGR